VFRNSVLQKLGVGVEQSRPEGKKEHRGGVKEKKILTTPKGEFLLTRGNWGPGRLHQERLNNDRYRRRRNRMGKVQRRRWATNTQRTQEKRVTGGHKRRNIKKIERGYWGGKGEHTKVKKKRKQKKLFQRRFGGNRAKRSRKSNTNQASIPHQRWYRGGENGRKKKKKN